MVCLFRLEEIGIELLGVLSSVDHLIFMPSTFFIPLSVSLFIFVHSVKGCLWHGRVKKESKGVLRQVAVRNPVCGIKKERREGHDEKLSLLFLINLVMHGSASLPSTFFFHFCLSFWPLSTFAALLTHFTTTEGTLREKRIKESLRYLSF